MAKGQAGMVLQFVRRVVGARASDDSPDGQLLDRFVAFQDEHAFAALFQRHAPMVLGVCQRVLQDRGDAEDACQAAFLVLARKAGAVRGERSAAGWLYRVAYHLAVKAKAAALKRRSEGRGLAAMSGSDPATEAVQREVRAVLDEELYGLPEKYRAPLILCYLQGMAAREAARELGWPEGSMSKRLQRGLELLRERLTRRGLALSGGAFAAAFAQSAAAAVVPAALGHSMVQAALAFAAGKEAAAGVVSAPAAGLAEGMLHAATIARLKVAAAVLLVVSVGAAGAGAAAGRAWAEWSRAANGPIASRGRPEPGKVRTDPPHLLGEVAAYEKGKSVTLEVLTGAGKRSFEYAIDVGRTEVRVIGGVARSGAAKPPSDVVVGMQASVWVDKDDAKIAARIVANTKTPTVQGKVAAYEEGRRLAIEAATPAGGGQKLEFAIGKDAAEIRLLPGAKGVAVGAPASVWAEQGDPQRAALIEVKLR